MIKLKGTVTRREGRGREKGRDQNKKGKKAYFICTRESCLMTSRSNVAIKEEETKYAIVASIRKCKLFFVAAKPRYHKR